MSPERPGRGAGGLWGNEGAPGVAELSLDEFWTQVPVKTACACMDFWSRHILTYEYFSTVYFFYFYQHVLRVT